MATIRNRQRGLQGGATIRNRPAYVIGTEGTDINLKMYFSQAPYEATMVFSFEEAMDFYKNLTGAMSMLTIKREVRK